MDEKEYMVAFELVATAGNSKSYSMMAIQAAREGRFEDAEEQMAEAEKELQKAHQSQTDMLQQEARGDKVPLNIILVHAQDHLTMALLMRDIAKEFIEVYRRLDEAK